MDKDTFCIVPWIHFIVRSTGQVAACCEQSGGIDYGKFQSNIHETANLDGLKKLRKDLYNGKRSKYCNKCWIAEDKNLNSFRKNYNDLYYKYSNKQFVDSLTDYNDFSVNKNFKLRYLDIRSSNLCNYKCRMCGIGSSNSWWQFIKDNPKREDVKELKSYDHFNDKTGVIEFDLSLLELKEHIPYIEVVNLAGGEPLMLPGTYKLIEEFIKQNKKDTTWNLISNTSRLSYGKKNIIDLLSYFDKFRWKMSLDAIGGAHEYLRSDTSDWNIVYENSQKLIDYRSKNTNMDLDVHSSVSWVGLYRFYDVWKMYHQTTDYFKMNPVIVPKHMSIDILPRDDLCEALEFYQKKVIDHKGERNIGTLEVMVEYLRSTSSQKINASTMTTKAAVKQQVLYDKQRGTDLFKTFPEWGHFKKLLDD